MGGEQNGAQEAQQQEGGQHQAAQQQEQETQQTEIGTATAAFEAQLAERDARIEELEGQIA